MIKKRNGDIVLQEKKDKYILLSLENRGLFTRVNDLSIVEMLGLIERIRVTVKMKVISLERENERRGK